MSETHENSAFVEEQWIEKDGGVYRRVRWDGEEWSEWELTPHKHMPFYKMDGKMVYGRHS